MGVAFLRSWRKLLLDRWWPDLATLLDFLRGGRTSGKERADPVQQPPHPGGRRPFGSSLFRVVMGVVVMLGRVAGDLSANIVQHHSPHSASRVFQVDLGASESHPPH